MNKKKQFKKKLLHKYRLVVLNEDTFEERISFKLSRLNVFVVSAFFAVFLIAFTTVLIAFTPLREYIPGYSSTELERKAYNLIYVTDSLEKVVAYNHEYLGRVKKVLTGELETTAIDKDSVFEEYALDADSIDLNPIKEDLLLREEVEREDKYSLFEDFNNSSDFVFFPPITGMISETYNLTEKHYGVDVVAPENSPVKAAADGTVIFAEWTAETGYVIIIEHPFEFITVYKHNAFLTKEQGALVKAGEVIATVGNTGEFTTGTHLHFEVWHNGYPVDPSNYIDFE